MMITKESEACDDVEGAEVIPQSEFLKFVS